MSHIETDNKQKSKKRKTKKKKKSIWSKILTGFLILLLAILVTGGGYLYGLFNKLDTVALDDSDLGISPQSDFSQYDNYKKIKNIALFGVDAEDGGVGRSDSIMVVTIDPEHNKLKVTSFMRDSYVNIEGHGMDKLNHAYAFGGPQLAIKTLNQNFGLNIEDFATVNFSSLPIIIDILGGINLEITSEEIQYINGYIDHLNSISGTRSPHITSSGMQHIDGTQALAYSRIRYTSGGDYERTQRHRLVLSALFEKLSNTPASSYSSILNSLLPYVQTNLGTSNILSLGTKVLGVGNGTLEQERFPRDGYCEGTMIDGVYYLDFNRDSTIKQVRDYIFDDN